MSIKLITRKKLLAKNGGGGSSIELDAKTVERAVRVKSLVSYADRKATTDVA